MRIRPDRGGAWVTEPSKFGGPPVTTFHRDPKPRKEPRPDCPKCWDTGRVSAGPVDPDDPWSPPKPPLDCDCPAGRTTT